jgi:serine/threonine protein kinase
VIQQLPQPIEFGKYTLFERLGRGGMADVYKGRIKGPAGFERIFVVKRILPHLSDDPAFIRMFVNEAKLSARLNHPNIVQIFELGSVEGEYFIAMEYVHGQDLSATIRALWKSATPPVPALVSYVGREVCMALAYAHRLTDEHGRPLGMIHRDVSPSNVMLSYDGAVKLLDFGIAKVMGDAPEGNRGHDGGAGGGGGGGGGGGEMKGKYAYMAPEQTESVNVDHRIDIFAAGIVLYEAVAGRRLFKGASDMQTIERVRRCDVKPPSFLNPACPPELDAILLKALARDPAQRFQTASEMGEALDDLVHATRFTPQQLATTLRTTFGVEAGLAPPATHRSTPVTASSTGSSTGSPSGSISTTYPSVRSPTISPMVFSPPSEAIGVTGMAGGSSAFDASIIGSLLVKPLWQRAPFWAALVLCLSGVGFAVFKNVLHGPATASPPTVAMAAAGRPSGDGSHASTKKVRKVAVLLQSDPEGADIFVTGRLETVGVTPMWFGLDLDADNPTRVMFRKAGFQDKAIAVETERPALVQLIPNTVPPAEANPPSPIVPSALKVTAVAKPAPLHAPPHIAPR